MNEGDTVRVVRGRSYHPWRQDIHNIIGWKGILLEVKDVHPSKRNPSGKIYVIEFEDLRRKRKFTRPMLVDNLKCSTKPESSVRHTSDEGESLNGEN